MNKEKNGAPNYIHCFMNLKYSVKPRTFSLENRSFLKEKFCLEISPSLTARVQLPVWFRLRAHSTSKRISVRKHILGNGKHMGL